MTPRCPLPRHTLTWATGEPNTGGSHSFIYRGCGWLPPASLAHPHNGEPSVRPSSICPSVTRLFTHGVDALEPPLVCRQLCPERLVFHPFVVKVASFVVGDVWRCQQLVIDPESELWAEGVSPVVSEETSRTGSKGHPSLPY